MMADDVFGWGRNCKSGVLRPLAAIERLRRSLIIIKGLRHSCIAIERFDGSVTAIEWLGGWGSAADGGVVLLARHGTHPPFPPATFGLDLRNNGVIPGHKARRYLRMM
jgi:hypothetical protein